MKIDFHSIEPDKWCENNSNCYKCYHHTIRSIEWFKIDFLNIFEKKEDRIIFCEELIKSLNYKLNDVEKLCSNNQKQKFVVSVNKQIEITQNYILELMKEQ